MHRPCARVSVFGSYRFACLVAAAAGIASADGIVSLDVPATAAQSRPVTLRALVTSPLAGTVPRGTVEFLDGAAVLGLAVLDSGGEASFTAIPAVSGTRMLRAVYAGDARHGRGVSASVPLLVLPESGAASMPPADPGAVVADFNGDGILDEALARPESGTVAIRLGNGDGEFAHNPMTTQNRISLSSTPATMRIL